MYKLQNFENQYSWLIEHVASLLRFEEHFEIVLLVTNPAQTTILEEILAQSQFVARIHIVPRKEELYAVLKEQGKQQIIDNELMTQVA